MKVLVTGANGYIGRHVVATLLEHGNEVIACDINIDDIDSRAERKVFNLFNIPEENLYEVLGSPDLCIHMAWRNGFIHNSDTHMGDLSYHYRFLNTLLKGGLKRLAVMGTMHEVGYWEGAIDENTPCNPISMYGIAKDSLRRAMIADCYALGCKLQWLRCYYILGDDRKNNSIFCKLLKANDNGDKIFPFTKGENKYDFIDVEELSKQISAVVMQSEINGIINCCTGIPMSLAERVEQFIADNNLDIKLNYGVFQDRPYDSPCVYGDPSKIKKIMLR